MIRRFAEFCCVGLRWFGFVAVSWDGMGSDDESLMGVVRDGQEEGREFHSLLRCDVMSVYIQYWVNRYEFGMSILWGKRQISEVQVIKRWYVNRGIRVNGQPTSLEVAFLVWYHLIVVFEQDMTPSDISFEDFSFWYVKIPIHYWSKRWTLDIDELDEAVWLTVSTQINALKE